MKYRSVSQYLVDTIKWTGGAIGKIIDWNRLISSFFESHNSMGTNISGTARYEYDFLLCFQWKS